MTTGVTEFYSAYGTFNMSGIGIISDPGIELTAKLYIENAIDASIPSNFENMKEREYLVIELIVRNCIMGEGLRESGACFACPEGSFLLSAPTEPTECDVCPKEQANCLGGTNIGPKEGYWRKSNMTAKFLPCKIDDVCLGMDPTLP